MCSVDGSAWRSGRLLPRLSPFSLTRSRRPWSAGHRTSVGCAEIGATERDTKRSRMAGGGRTQGVAWRGSLPFSPLARSRHSQVRCLTIPCSLRSKSRSSRRPCRSPARKRSCRQARNLVVAARGWRRRAALPPLPRQAGSRAASRRVEPKAAGTSARSKQRLVLHPRRRLATSQLVRGVLASRARPQGPRRRYVASFRRATRSTTTRRASSWIA
jgi:hypothetical protein